MKMQHPNLKNKANRNLQTEPNERNQSTTILQTLISSKMGCLEKPK